MSYNYLNAVIEDVKQAIEENINLDEYRGNREELEEKLNDDLFVDDSVTGNASGSYTFNSYTAGEYVKDNLNLVSEMANCFGVSHDEIGKKFLDEEWEYFDVSIRCYLLGQAISKVLDEIEESGSLDEIESEPNEELINLATQYKASEPETAKAAETIKA